MCYFLEGEDVCIHKTDSCCCYNMLFLDLDSVSVESASCTPSSWGIQSLTCHNSDFKFRGNPREKFWSRWCLSFLPQFHILFLGLFYVFFFNYFYFSGFVLGLHSCMQAFSSCREWVLLSNCDAWVSHHSGFCCCGAQALGWVYVLQQLQHVGSVVAVPGLWSTHQLNSCAART